MVVASEPLHGAPLLACCPLYPGHNSKVTSIQTTESKPVPALTPPTTLSCFFQSSHQLKWLTYLFVCLAWLEPCRCGNSAWYIGVQGFLTFVAWVNGRVFEVHRPSWAGGPGALGGLLRINYGCCDVSLCKHVSWISYFFGYWEITSIKCIIIIT